MRRYTRAVVSVESPCIGDGGYRVLRATEEMPPSLSGAEVRALLDEGVELGRRLGERIERMRWSR